MVPAVPSSIIEPIWHQFEALIPPVADEHPLGCQVLVFPTGSCSTN
jgi:hypothetical protein